MALSVFVWICALFILGRNVFSLLFKIKSLINDEERKELKNSTSNLFGFIILNITAVAGIICGIAMLFPNVIFGYYLFIVVSGMMIYSYFIYAGICFEGKKWFMFGLCIVVVLFTAILVGIMSFYLATGFFD